MMKLPSFSSTKGSRIEIGEGSAFLHTFGGETKHKGAVCSSSGQKLQLLLNIDTSDPLTSECKLNVKGVPIFFSPASATDLQYQLISDSEVRVIYQDKSLMLHSLPPYPDFPTVWPARSAKLIEIPYDFMKTIAYWGTGLRLSPADDVTLEQFGHPYHQWGGYFSTARENSICMNPLCKNFEGSIRYLGVIQNKISDSERLLALKDQIIKRYKLLIEACTLCNSIRTSCYW